MTTRLYCFLCLRSWFFQFSVMHTVHTFAESGALAGLGAPLKPAQGARVVLSGSASEIATWTGPGACGESCTSEATDAAAVHTCGIQTKIREPTCTNAGGTDDACACGEGYSGDDCETPPPGMGGWNTAAASCAHAKHAHPSATSGTYWLKPRDDAAAFRAFCDMEPVTIL